jgi:hypothetical protein|tara:strand:- start:471 stop:635 length:165 start_codon:yes stop_codon:yes gene_type:complete
MNIKEAKAQIEEAIDFSNEMFEGDGSEEDKALFIEKNDEALELVMSSLNLESKQ